MADVDNRNDREVVVERERSSSAGPIIAVVAVILLVLFALWAFSAMGGSDMTDTTTPEADVNIQAPAPETDSPAPSTDGQ